MPPSLSERIAESFSLTPAAVAACYRVTSFHGEIMLQQIRARAEMRQSMT